MCSTGIFVFVFKIEVLLTFIAQALVLVQGKGFVAFAQRYCGFV